MLIWTDSLNNTLIQEDSLTKNAFYGEKLNLNIEIEEFGENTELEIEFIAQDENQESVILEEDKNQPLKITSKITSSKVIFPFYVNPRWFKRDNPLTFLFNLKVKGSSNFIGKSLPNEVSNQLKPNGFGKPSRFENNAPKGFLYVLKKGKKGSRIGEISGNKLDIPTYQKWFEDDSNELEFKNDFQVESYFISAYGIKYKDWVPTNHVNKFGTDANVTKIIELFESISIKHNIPPSVIFTYAAGEGLIFISKQMGNNFKRPLNSFQAFGLDFFGSKKDLNTLYNQGYLERSFKSGGTVNTGLDEINYPGKFPSKTSFMDLRESDGAVCIRDEAGGPTQIYPVWFKSIKEAATWCAAVYIKAYMDSINEADKLGWKSLNLNQKVYFGYYNIQWPNRKLTYYGNNNEEFLKPFRRNSWAVPKKAYLRFVSWRYLKLSKVFSN